MRIARRKRRTVVGGLSMADQKDEFLFESFGKLSDGTRGNFMTDNFVIAGCHYIPLNVSKLAMDKYGDGDQFGFRK